MTTGKYLLREYGSWGVMLLSFAAGLVAARGIGPASFGVLAGLALSINSKQALTEWLRKGNAHGSRALPVLFLQIAGAAFLFLVSLGNTVFSLLPYAVVPLAYLICLRLLGEHALPTEVAGFVLLSLSAPVAHASVTAAPDLRLFLAVSAFFCAGVFKVKIQFRKRVRDRIAMMVYLAAAAAAYLLASLPVVCLAPLADNAVFALRPYSVKLRTTGWTEVAKGAAFVLLVGLFWR